MVRGIEKDVANDRVGTRFASMGPAMVRGIEEAVGWGADVLVQLQWGPRWFAG